MIFVSAWDIWHVLMQHYGFMRIYDAKQGVINSVVSRMDWAVSISWYLTLIIASPHYRHNLLSRAYAAGLPLISTSTFATVQNLMMICTATLTLAYVGYHLHLWRTGRPVSFRKLALLGIFPECHLLPLCLCRRLRRWILYLVGISLHSVLRNCMGL